MIRVFVGCASNGDDAESQAVLEHSLRKNTEEDVDIVWMALSRDPASFWASWNSGRWSTPFTGFRWGVPAYCNFEGRAIYTDSDVIFMADVAELWNQPIPDGKIALIRNTEDKLRTCVTLFDCAAAKAHIPPIAKLRAMDDQHGRMTAYLRDNRHLLGQFDGLWNAIDLKRTDLHDPALKLIHYSQMTSQPHLALAKARMAKRGLPHWYDGETEPHPRPELDSLFHALLKEAIAHGYPPERYEPAVPYGVYRKKSQAGRKAKWQ